MANLKEIKARISSVSSTMKITSAMKMVSAAKLKKAQDRISNIKPYADGFNRIIQNILPSVSNLNNKLTELNNQSNKVLFIPITSNRGLCGGFNANIFKKIKELSQTKFQNMDVEVFCIGKKASDAAGRARYNIINLDENIIANRIHVYLEKTAVLASYYDKQKKYFSLNGLGTIDEITDRVFKELEK